MSNTRTTPRACGWTLAEAPGVLALFNKSRPTLSQRFGREPCSWPHPVDLDQIERFDAVRAGTAPALQTSATGTARISGRGRACLSCSFRTPRPHRLSLVEREPLHVSPPAGARGRPRRAAREGVGGAVPGPASRARRVPGHAEDGGAAEERERRAGGWRSSAGSAGGIGPTWPSSRANSARVTSQDAPVLFQSEGGRRPRRRARTRR